MTAAESSNVTGRPFPRASAHYPAAVETEQDAARATAELYASQYSSMVRLAALLVRDASMAEEIVQEAFIAMHASWRRLRETDKATAYLRQAVVNKSHSVLRHRMVTERNAPPPPPDMPSAEQGAIEQLERSAVIAALQELPQRQREALVLKYYVQLQEAQIASVMGISRGAVKSHIFRGMSALRIVLEGEA